MIRRPPSSGKYRAAELPPAWDHSPNPNPPVGSVGPQADPGRTAMFPTDEWPAEGWDGWPVEWRTPWYGAGGPDPWSGYGYGRFNEHGSRVSTVMSCVDLNARTLASMPVYGLKNLSPVQLPSWAVTPEPDTYADWTDFAKTMVGSYLLRGEVILYALARYANGWPSRFVALNPDMVNIDRVDARPVFSVGGVELDRRDVCHVKYQSWSSSVRGIGPLEWVGRNVVAAGALEKYASELAARNGVPWAVLKHPGNLTPKQTADMKSGWVKSRMGGGIAPAVLSGGVELETLTISPKDMALLELRVFDEQRIAAAFGVPPFLVGLPSPGSLTYSSTSMLFDYHWRATLRPMARSIAGALSRWALPYGTQLEFNAEDYISPSLSERAQAYSMLGSITQTDEVGNTHPVMTVDEMRMALRLTPHGAPVTADEWLTTGGAQAS